tara:strand:- start:731 stop:892 length:162 start_codon:yes stop_codon:yes gene_type:complete
VKSVALFLFGLLAIPNKAANNTGPITSNSLGQGSPEGQVASVFQGHARPSSNL